MINKIKTRTPWYRKVAAVGLDVAVWVLFVAILCVFGLYVVVLIQL